MKLWLLRPIPKTALDPGYDKEAAKRAGSPWEPWFDCCFGMVVRAKNEECARQLADQARDDSEEISHNHGFSVWRDHRLTSCVELLGDGDEGVIISDVWNS